MTYPNTEHMVQQWLTDNGWSEVVDHEFVRRCAKRLATPEVTQKLVHYVCTNELSPHLYALCATSERQSQNIAFDALGRYLTRMVKKRIGDEEMAREAAINSLDAIHKALHTIRDPVGFIGFCQTVAVNEASHLLRAAARKRDLELSLDEPMRSSTGSADDDAPTLGERIADPAEPFAALVEQADARSRFWECVKNCRALTERARQIVFLLFKERLTHVEVCRRLSMTRGALDTALSRAKNAMRDDERFKDCVTQLSLLGD